MACHYKNNQLLGRGAV